MTVVAAALIPVFSSEVRDTIERLFRIIQRPFGGRPSDVLQRNLQDDADSRASPLPPRPRSAFADLLSFNPNQDVVFLFPTRDPAPGRPLRDVAWEDMRAVDYVERALLDSGWPRDRITLKGVKQYSKRLDELTQGQLKRIEDRFKGWPDGAAMSTDVRYSSGLEELTKGETKELWRHITERDKQQNLVLICSPRSNKVTEKALAELGNFLDVIPDLQTPADSELPWWKLRFFGGEHESPSFRQTDPEGVRVDQAVIAKVKPPPEWHSAAKILFVFGIRGIGTWGAAKYFFENAPMLQREFGDEEFVIRIRVTYRNWRILPDTVLEDRKNAEELNRYLSA